MVRAVWPSEDQIQAAVIEWCRLQRDGAQMTFHIPNGGKRSKVTGARLKKQGVLAGVVDLFVPVARNGWHGCWVELKAHGKKLTADQSAFLSRMHSEGYLTGWFDNAQEATAFIGRYVAGRVPRPNWVHYSAEVKA